MKKKIVFSFILGMLVSVLGVYASVSLSSDKVSYKDTTVKGALDDLFNESVSGKNNIISALSNKGFNVQDNSTYTDIVNGINELPVTIGKDSDGNYGYLIEDSDLIPFKKWSSEMVLIKSLTFMGGSNSGNYEKNGTIDCTSLPNYKELDVNDFYFNIASYYFYSVNTAFIVEPDLTFTSYNKETGTLSYNIPVHTTNNSYWYGRQYDIYYKNGISI